MKVRRGGRAVAVLTVLAALLTTLAAGLGGPADAHEENRVVYAGSGVNVWRASGQLDRLHGTSRAFRQFVRSELDRMWEEYNESDPACARAALVKVKEYRKRVAYIANQGTFGGGPGDVPDSCASGGAFRFYVKRDGEWRAPYALGGQDVVRCRVFRRWDIPRMNGARHCWNGRAIVRWAP